MLKPEPLYARDVTHCGTKLIDEMSVEELRHAVRVLKASNNALNTANLAQASIIDRHMKDIPSAELEAKEMMQDG